MEYNSDKEAVEITNSEFVFPTHANRYGNIFGGRVIELMDMAGVLAATQFANEEVVTVSIEAVNFKKPIKVGDMVEVNAKIVNTAKTSLVVKVEVYRVDRFRSRKDFACKGYFIFVAINANGEPRDVPKLKLVTDEDIKYWEIGQRIIQRSKERKQTEEIE